MLQRLYTLQRIHKEVRPTSHIYLATPLTPRVLLRIQGVFLGGVLGRYSGSLS